MKRGTRYPFSAPRPARPARPAAAATRTPTRRWSNTADRGSAGAAGSDEVARAPAADADGGAGGGGLDHLAVADVHGDVVDALDRVAVEEQVTGDDLVHRDPRRLVPLDVGAVGQAHARRAPGPHGEAGAVVGVGTGPPVLVRLAQLAHGPVDGGGAQARRGE